jgi:hypothetical protein
MTRPAVLLIVLLLAALPIAAQRRSYEPALGEERAVTRHLEDGDLFRIPLREIIDHGRQLFSANWTDEDGAGRPFGTGAGKPLSDPSQPLEGSRSFNRVSGPDANSCAGCHNRPAGAVGGAGDIVANAFEAAQRFDFVTFDRRDAHATRGSVDEAARRVSLATVGNPRATPSLFGAGYIELLARQMTADLRRIRDAIEPGQSRRLVSKGVSFGTLARRADGTWITKAVEGLPPQSLRSASAAAAPALVIRPWHQSGSVVSLRDFINTAFNRHHGIQTTERFGRGTDADRDGVSNEMTSADVTAVTFFLATLPVPGRVIPSDPEIARAVATGERLFNDIRCTRCHVSSLPLDRRGWIYSEPGPYNPAGNLRAGQTKRIDVDLTDAVLPQPRLAPAAGEPSVIQIPAYTDFKLHDITDAADATAEETLDMNQPVGSPAFLAGNRRFLTRRLWGIASHPAHLHHGLLTTLREAVLAHAGEALAERTAFQRLDAAGQDAVIEFLKSLQMLPPGTRDLVVDEQYRARK